MRPLLPLTSQHGERVLVHRTARPSDTMPFDREAVASARRRIEWLFAQSPVLPGLPGRIPTSGTTAIRSASRLLSGLEALTSHYRQLSTLLGAELDASLAQVDEAISRLEGVVAAREPRAQLISSARSGEAAVMKLANYSEWMRLYDVEYARREQLDRFRATAKVLDHRVRPN